MGILKKSDPAQSAVWKNCKLGWQAALMPRWLVQPATKTLLAPAVLIAAFCAVQSHAAEWKVDPSYLYRDTNAVAANTVDMTTSTCRYKPLFGAGDTASPPITTDGSILGSVARYGEAILDPNGSSDRFQCLYKFRLQKKSVAFVPGRALSPSSGFRFGDFAQIGTWK